MKTGIIIQARLGSSRLPEKVLLPIVNNRNLLQTVIDRLAALKIPIVVATTVNASDDKLANYLLDFNIPYFRGSEENVLTRFIAAAEHFGLSRIIRVCADNPFIDALYLQRIIESWEDSFDYLSYEYRGTPTVLTHFGIFAECVSLKALKKVSILARANQSYREHVTYGIYNNPDLFNLKFIDITHDLSDYEGIRLTIDTQADYLNILEIYRAFEDEEFVDFWNVAKWIKADQSIFGNMKLNIENNEK